MSDSAKGRTPVLRACFRKRFPSVRSTARTTITLSTVLLLSLLSKGATADSPTRAFLLTDDTSDVLMLVQDSDQAAAAKALREAESFAASLDRQIASLDSIVQKLAEDVARDPSNAQLITYRKEVAQRLSEMREIRARLQEQIDMLKRTSRREQ